MNKSLSFTLSAMLIAGTLLTKMSCSSKDDPAGPDCSTLNVTVPLANITEPTGCAGNDGQIIAVGAGGSEPYQYKIGSGAYQASATFSNLGAGTYLVTIKDSKGCEKVSSNVIVENGGSDLLASVKEEDNIDDTDCLGGNGELTVTVAGGTGPYQFKLNSGAFGGDATFSGLQGGTYSITVKDAENCTSVIEVNVENGVSGLTYTADIKPILQAKCQFTGCHPTNGDWFTYSIAKDKRADIKARTGDGSMPKSPQPGGALTADEIKKIACWVDDEAPQ